MEGARANGPGESFEEYYRGDIVELTHFVMKLGASYEQGWDVAQEAMKEAMVRWVTIQMPRAYTRRVAAIVYFGQIDAEAVQRASALRYVEQRQRAPGIVTPALSFTDETKYVLELLAGLPPRQRTVMALHYDGFSFDEIAVMTKQNLSTVRSHLRHARDALKQRIEFRR